MRPESSLIMATVYIQTHVVKTWKKTYAVKYKAPDTRKNRHYKTFKKWRDANDEKLRLISLIDSGQVDQVKKPKQTILTLAEVTE